MRSTTKRRLERRFQLATPLPAFVRLRSLLRDGRRGVEGALVDVSKNGIGVLVQENVALDSRCTVEVRWNDALHEMKGEVCYATRTDAGVRLGIMLAEKNRTPLLDLLTKAKVEME